MGRAPRPAWPGRGALRAYLEHTTSDNSTQHTAHSEPALHHGAYTARVEHTSTPEMSTKAQKSKSAHQTKTQVPSAKQIAYEKKSIHVRPERPGGLVGRCRCHHDVISKLAACFAGAQGICSECIRFCVLVDHTFITVVIKGIDTRKVCQEAPG